MQRHFNLHPSRQLFICIVFFHTLLIGVLLFIPFSSSVLVSLCVVLLCSMTYYVLRDAGLKLESACVALRVEGDDGVVLINRKGLESLGQLLSSSVVTPHLLVLNVKLSGERRRRNVIVMPDSMDAQSFRHLRVALKWQVASV
ncbi:MAG: protein YgfX [Gallionellaceae bacterium]